MKKIIYLDNAATTKVAPEVVEAMLPYFTEYYGNPSSVYELAGISKKAVTEGREKVASVIGANPNDIYFTAGGSGSPGEQDAHGVILSRRAQARPSNRTAVCIRIGRNPAASARRLRPGWARRRAHPRRSSTSGGLRRWARSRRSRRRPTSQSERSR